MLSENGRLHYEATLPTYWQGRNDGPRLHHRINCVDIADAGFPRLPGNQPLFGIIGFCCDEGIYRNQGRTGAKEAPNAIRRASANLALHTHKDAYFIDVGNIVCEEQDLENAQLALAEVVSLLKHHRITPIVLGGGHEVAYAHYLGLSTHSQRLGIINLDAHFDIRPLLDHKGNSGTPFLQIAEHMHSNHKDFHYLCLGIQPASNTVGLTKAAETLRVSSIKASTIHQNGLQSSLDAIAHLSAQVDHIYLTVCLDVVAAAFAPGVSAPQPLGLYPTQVAQLITAVKSTQKVIGFDIAELSPPLDQEHITEKLAAQFLWTFLEG